MFCTAQSASRIRPIKQLQLHVNLHILEDIIVEHFIVLKFFLAGPGPQISACFAQVKVPRFIPSVCQLQLHVIHVYLKTLLLRTSQS